MSKRRPTPTILTLILFGWTLLYANPAYAMPAPAPASPAPHCASMAAASSAGEHPHAHHHNGASCSCPHACQSGPAIFAAMATATTLTSSHAHPPVVVRHSSGFTTPPDRPPSA